MCSAVFFKNTIAAGVCARAFCSGDVHGGMDVFETQMCACFCIGGRTPLLSAECEGEPLADDVELNCTAGMYWGVQQTKSTTPTTTTKKGRSATGRQDVEFSSVIPLHVERVGLRRSGLVIRVP